MLAAGARHLVQAPRPDQHYTVTFRQTQSNATVRSVNSRYFIPVARMINEKDCNVAMVSEGGNELPVNMRIQCVLVTQRRRSGPTLLSYRVLVSIPDAHITTSPSSQRAKFSRSELGV